MSDWKNYRYIATDFFKIYLQNLGIDTSKPFRCLNPHHEDTYPSMMYFENSKSDVNIVKCFSCGKEYNIFEVIALVNNFPLPLSKEEKERKDIKLDKNFFKAKDLATSYFFSFREKKLSLPHIKNYYARVKKNKDLDYQADYNISYSRSEQKDNLKFLADCKKSLSRNQKAIEYLKSRGITEEVFEKWDIGATDSFISIPTMELNFYNKLQSVEDKKIMEYWKKLGYSYTLRNYNSNKKFDRIRKNGKLPLINYYILLKEKNSLIYIVEGEFDFLSCEVLGVNAIALSSLVNIKSFASRLKEDLKEIKANNLKFILMLDNDEGGRKGTEQLAKNLEYLGLNFEKSNLLEKFGYKDINDFLKNDKKNLIKFMKR